MLELNKKRVAIVIALVIIIVQAVLLNFTINMPPYKKNISDLILYVIGDPHIVNYLFSLIFMILTIYLLNKELVNQYILLRYKSKAQWYIRQIIILFLYSLIFVLFIVIICFLSGVLNLSTDPYWSEFSKQFSCNNIAASPVVIKNMVTNYNPYFLIFMNALFLIGYLFMIGLTCFIINLKAKNNSIGVFLTYGALILSLLINNAAIPWINKLIPYKNVIMSEHNLGQNKYLPSIKFSIAYFIIINLLLLIIGFKVSKNADLKFGEKKL